MTTDPEKATIGDLFRLMTEANKKLDSHTGRLETIESTLAEHTVKLDDAAAEREAIRQTVDSLPTFEQVVTVEHGVASLQSDSKVIRGDMRRLATRIDRAGIPAE